MTSVYDQARGYEIAFSYSNVPEEVDALVRRAGSNAILVFRPDLRSERIGDDSGVAVA